MRHSVYRFTLAATLFFSGCAPDPDGVSLDQCGPAATAPAFAVALNAYYLQEEAARALRAGSNESGRIDEVFSKARQLGVTVVRTNGFNDGADKIGDSAIQIAPLIYDETALRGLDLVLARARAYGIKLVLPLGNYWDDYGGARRYVEWATLPDPRQGDPRFFTERTVVDLYREHIRRLLLRVNTIDGLSYAGHPAILAFELLNEPRGAGLDRSGAQMRTWVDELAQHVKTLAPTKLVGTGEEGFDLPGTSYEPVFWNAAAPLDLFAGGSSYVLNTGSPWVDYGSVQLYPEEWGFRSESIASAGVRWIAEHARIARNLGKPVLVSEFGLRNDGPLTLTERRDTYRAWLGCASRSGAIGAAPWLFAYDARPATWDPYTFYLRSGTTIADPVNSYGDIIAAAAAVRGP